MTERKSREGWRVLRDGRMIGPEESAARDREVLAEQIFITRMALAPEDAEQTALRAFLWARMFLDVRGQLREQARKRDAEELVVEGV